MVPVEKFLTYVGYLKRHQMDSPALNNSPDIIFNIDYKMLMLMLLLLDFRVCISITDM